VSKITTRSGGTEGAEMVLVEFMVAAHAAGDGWRTQADP
jgi:hypothetical protein